MIFNFIIESYLKHLLFYFQTFLHTLIPNGTDLNNWKIPGYYATGLNEHNCKNTPVEVSKLLFYLIVLKAYYTYQILFSGNSKLYIRVFNEDNKTWGSWN